MAGRNRIGIMPKASGRAHANAGETHRREPADEPTRISRGGVSELEALMLRHDHRQCDRRVIRFTSHVVIASALFCMACKAPDRAQAATQVHRNEAAELAALQLSQVCATAADTFWRRYDRPSQPAKDATVKWSYQSHYSPEQKRCFIRVDSAVLRQSGSATNHQEVFDAIEGGAPLAILNVDEAMGASPDTKEIDLRKADAVTTPTPENLEWFRGLMSR